MLLMFYLLFCAGIINTRKNVCFYIINLLLMVHLGTKKTHIQTERERGYTGILNILNQRHEADIMHQIYPGTYILTIYKHCLVLWYIGP